MNSEGALLKRIRHAVLSAGEKGARPVRLGVGDDAAIFVPRRGRELVISSDFLLEGVHFTSSHSSDAIGYKTLARGVSDLAAMGAAPLGFLLNLAMPSRRTGTWLGGFLNGLDRAARSFHIRLIGGDLAKSPQIAICVVVTGDTPTGRSIRRSGARAGDLIYVSGTLGAARLGLEIMLQHQNRRRDAAPLLKQHLYPQPRLGLGCWLARHRAASAMMDISDGLSIDLARLCEASRVGAVLYEDRIPAVSIPNSWRTRLGLGQRTNLEFAFHGGDDYELLFTVPKRYVGVLNRWRGAVPVTCIGEIRKGRGILLVTTTGTHSLKPLGWDHFKSPGP
jgi:thiamine-monophosphate kinase